MRRFTVAMLMILTINVSPAQTKLGIKISPSIISQRIINSSEDVITGPAAISLPVLAFSDIPLGRNYFVSTGVGYLARRMLFMTNSSQNSTSNEIDLRIQYLQIPATLKLTTDEIALDKRLYFQFGPVVEFKLHDKTASGSLPEEITPTGGNISIMLAAGIDILVSPNTSIQIGVNYSRGLINIFQPTGHASYISEIPDVRSDIYGIDLAIKF